jgi:hypothetical protein
MEHTRKDFIAIIVGLSIAGVLAFVVVTHSGRDHQDVVVPNSGQAVDTSSTSTYLVATTQTVIDTPRLFRCLSTYKRSGYNYDVGGTSSPHARARGEDPWTRDGRQP